MSSSESDESVFEFDFDTDISEFSGFSAEESSDSEVDVDEPALADPEWQGQHFTPPTIEPFVEETGPVLPDDFDTHTATPLDFFYLLFPIQLISQIVTYTNGYARWIQRQPRGKEDSTWYPVTLPEMRSFLGINLLMGINQLPRMEMYWSTNTLVGNQAVAAVMTCNRFKKILQYFHVADKNSEPPRQSPEYRLCKVRPVIDVVADTCQSTYNLSRQVTVDEAMIGFSGRLSYRQYMPAKPVKRGIKVWMLCDATNGFLSRFEFYLGRQDNQTEHGLGYNVVTRLTNFLYGTWRMVFMDNFFTGIQLLKDLLANGLYACGTVRANRKGFPDELKKPATVKNRGDMKVMQYGNTNLVATTWKDKKLVHHLSTMSNPVVTTDAQRRSGPNVLHLRQPETVDQYNRYMGGVDLHDQLRMKYPCGRHSKKAWRYIFWFLLNSCITNAFILYKSSSTRRLRKKRYDHMDFRLELIRQLIGGFTKRKRSPTMDNRDQQAYTDNGGDHCNVRMPGNPKTCKYHSRNMRKRKETVFGCQVCGIHLCRDGPCHAQWHSQP